MSYLPVFLALPNVENSNKSSGNKISDDGKIFSNVRFWLATLTGIGAFFTMTLIMSATPLQMNDVEHFLHTDTASTIQSHIIAMYLPALFSGWLLSKFGIERLISIGVALFLICISITFFYSQFHHYWVALVLLGIAWNFLFLAGSTIISTSFTGPQRFRAQGANDTLVFGAQSLASIVAGWILFSWGWKTLILLPVPILVGLQLLLILKPSKI